MRASALLYVSVTALTAVCAAAGDTVIQIDPWLNQLRPADFDLLNNQGPQRTLATSLRKPGEEMSLRVGVVVTGTLSDGQVESLAVSSVNAARKIQGNWKRLALHMSSRGKRVLVTLSVPCGDHCVTQVNLVYTLEPDGYRMAYTFYSPPK